MPLRIIFTALCYLLIHASGAGCSCGTLTQQTTDFVGEIYVERIMAQPMPSQWTFGGILEYTYLIEVWSCGIESGPELSLITVLSGHETNGSRTSCDVNFEKGKSYHILARNYEQGYLTQYCFPRKRTE